MSTTSSLFRFPRKTALAASLTLVLMGADITSASATNWLVSNCQDGIGIGGSLRAAVTNANNSAGPNTNDTVEFMTQMQCSRITLSEGAIIVTAGNLTFNGPGADKLVVEGGNGAGSYGRVLTHTGTGTLTVNGLTISNGVVTTSNADAKGGCIFSSANVSLTGSAVSGCLAQDNSSSAIGGGIFAAGDIVLESSIVSGNRVFGASYSGGGGIHANGSVSVTNSTIRDNSCTVSANPSQCYGGGIDAFTQGRNVSIVGSTISGNRAAKGGGLYLSSNIAAVSNSTISGNTASTRDAGIFAFNTPLLITNSTITGNVTEAANSLGGVYSTPNYTLRINSSIIANNKSADVASDLNNDATIDPGSGQNLIYATGAMVPLTLKDTCPKLERLANNGGPTQTHALHSNSPAIGTGSNLLFSFLSDQRGMNFPRKFGAEVDIGAYERQNVPDEQIFHSGFESGCDE